MTAPSPADVFRQEAQELLEQLEQALLDLEQSPGDRALVDTAFRALHTLKGSGAMFGFDALAGFTHHVESAFDMVRKGQVAPSSQLITVALAAKDRMRVLIERPDQADATAGEDILRALQAAMAPVPAVSQPPLQPPRVTWRIRFRLPANALVTGNNPLLLLDQLGALGTCTAVALTDGVPPLEAMQPDGCYLVWDVVLSTDRPRSAIEDVFMFLLDDMELKIDPVEEVKRLGEILVERGDIGRETVASALAQQERLGTLLVKAGHLSEDRLKAALAEQKHIRRAVETTREPPRANGNGNGNDSIRVPAERLDELMDRVGELVIAQARLKQLAMASADIQVRSVAEEIERLASELRETTMGIRMVPIGSLFGRFRRLVHDLSRELGKEVELMTDGEETELDKTVIERLNDPLVHLIRNAIDHGLEKPHARAEAGKPVCGRIHLAARHAGAQVLITITDDGHGLDRARIRTRAEEQGLLAPGARISDNDLLQMIFQPGFSTAREVTSVSGRGVGMDIVRRTIDLLRGTIDMSSTPGQGTELTLRLPLTLAIIDGLLVRIGQGRYVIPLSAVEECVELSAEEESRSTGRSFLNIRGDLVPYLRLRELFNAPPPPPAYQKVVIVSAGDLRVGLVVDQVIGDHQTVIKSLSKLHADVATFSGATILGDGTVALILDVAHLVEFGQMREQHRQAS